MAKSHESKNGAEVSGTLGDYEDAIRQIREVMAVRVVAGDRGGIDEIHVLAGNGRNPKQIVRDIESSLMAQFGLSVDHKRISVAQVEEGASTTWGSGRLRLLGVRFTTDAARAEAEVKVEFDDVIHAGRASGPASETNRLRVAAEATLAAVSEYFNSGYQLSLDDILVIAVRDKRIALTIMTILSSGGEDTLTGSSLIRGAEQDAVARSVLDALNRRFTMMVRKPGARPGPNGPSTATDENSS